MAHTGGNWRIGNYGSTVITDFFENTHDSDIRYYGGKLIGESILSKGDAKLIAAAPDLLAAAQEYIKQYNGNSTPAELYKQMVAAVDKATK